MAYVKKIISSANRAQRVEYSKEHLYKPLFSFWDYIIYIDKAYIDLLSEPCKRVSRELGTCIDLENIIERPSLKGV
jgi:hypothetical protein